MASTQPPSELTFGCVPHTDDEATRAKLDELCAWLAERTHVAVRPYRAPSFGGLAAAFHAGDVDVAWVSPALLITHAGLADARPIVCSIREGVALYHAVLFVQATSPYRSPSDLRGARAAWVAQTSAAGYIVPRLALAAHGLDPRTLFASETFHETYGNVARAVLSGEADVGSTFAVFAGGDPSRRLMRAGVEPIERARILYAAGPIPSDPVVVGPKVTTALVIALTDAFVAAGNDPRAKPALRHIMGADGFEMIRPKSFETLREEIHDGRELGLLAPA